MLETWKELSACTTSSHQSLRWSSVLLVLYALLAYTQALPLVHTAQKRSATPFEGVYNCNSSSSIGKCTHISHSIVQCAGYVSCYCLAALYPFWLFQYTNVLYATYLKCCQSSAHLEYIWLSAEGY